jgi:divinyl protochlorophyllide a 8-vinyl-reductase
MPEDLRPPAGTAGLIGPNAVLQLFAVLEERQGPAVARALLAAAGLPDLPAATGLMPEAPAAALHRALRAALPEAAPALLAEAGRRTADYILAHRIPARAQRLLRLMPPALAAPVVSRAIARHAWTFAGSGRFRAAGRLVFEIADNPVVRGESATCPACHWHAAVFERLFRALVDDRLRARETACCACGDPACRIALATA